MGTLSKCVAGLGKALDDTDRRDVLARYEAHTKDGMPASDAAELAIREVHAGVTDMTDQVVEAAAASNVQIVIADDIEMASGQPTGAEVDAKAAENERAKTATPFGFAAMILKYLGRVDDVYRAPPIPPTAKTVKAAVKVGIPDAVLIRTGNEEDSMAGLNSP